MMFDRSDRPQISLSLNDQQTCLESLEPRLLLSTLFGGETFEFQDAQQQRIIVSVGGNVVVEVIGGTVSINDNTVILHQMPGDIWTSSIGRGGIRLNGGFAGQKGSDPVTLNSLNGAPISYSAPGGLGGGGGPVTDNNLSVNALASNAEGDTYGFNFYEPTGGLGAPTVHLFRFVNHGSTGAVESQIADLGPRIRALVYGGTPPEDNPPEVRGVDAAAFNPIDGRLYFVATVNRPDLPNSPQGLEYVLSIDVSGNLLTASSTMRKVDNDGLFGDTLGDQQLQVHSIAFDQVLDTPDDYGTSSISGGAPSSYMWAYYTLTLPNIGERGVLAKYEVYDDGVIGPPRIDTNAPIRSTFLQIGTGVNAQPLLSIRGIDFNTFNPALEESGIFAITNEGNASSMLYLAFDPTAVNSLVVTINNFGTVFDPDDPDFTPTAADAAFNDQQIRGESPGSLTWNPVLVNPYTGRQGVFLFTDTETDDLMFVSELQRFGQANAFFVYVTQGDPNGYITFSVETLDEATGIRTITPYDGSLQEMRVIGLAAGDFITVNASGVGGAMLGAVTLDLSPDNPEDDLIPLLQASLSGSRLDDFYHSLGTLPAGLETITPGLVVARSLLSYYQPGISIADRLLKQNMDLVEGLSASGDGRTLALIDTDARSLFGFAYTTPGDELAFYDTVTRTLTTPVRVFYNVNPPGPDTVTYLPRVQGLDYGGGFFGEKLFAIYDLDSTAATDLRLGTIAVTGEFSPVAGGGQLDTSIVAVQAMAFTPDQTQLYIIGLNVQDEARLYRYDVDPDTGAMSNFQTIGRLVDAAKGEMPTNFGSMDFTGNTVGGLPQLLAHDRHNGRLVDISLTPVGVHVLVGANVATDKGSLRPAVGAITYDRLNNRMFAVDNTFGQMPLANENSTRTTAFVNGQLVVTHEAVDESAALMILTGMTSTSARPQDLRKFLFGGSVTGAVSISGSMQTFYAGWVILGDARGQNYYGSPLFPTNFYVGGDLLNLITAYNAGGLLADTDSTRDLQRVIYDTGLDIVVNGRLGQVRATGDFLGSVQVRNAVAPGELDFRYTSTPEIEVRTWSLSEEAANILVGGEWLDGNQVWNNQISETDFLLNDVNPQFLGALPLTTLGANTNIVRGNLSWSDIAPPDLADYYAVALMGGQTLSLQLATGELQVYLFDPDGNVVASNYSRVSDGTHQVFAYKATRPGVYRIGVFMLGDLNHTGAINDDINPVPLVDENYELRVTSLGNLAFGGLSAVRHIYSMDDISPAFEVDHGDLGALWAGDGLLLPAVSTGSIFFFGGADPLFSNIPGMSTIRVRSGDLRAIVGSSIGLDDAIEPGAEGFNQTGDFLSDPEIEVWSGNIGLIRSAAFMAVDIGTLTFIEDATNPATRAGLAALDIRPIGGNIQFIDAGYSTEENSIFWGNIRVNGSIGVFRADNVGMATYPASVSSLVSTSFEINASGTTAGAVLDMIDVRGNWGDFQDGGIPLSIGGGGNIRFIKVGGFAYNDRFFGAPGSSEASYDIDPNDPDKWLRNPVRIVDDGGAVFYVAPLRDVANPGYDPVASPDIEPSMPNFVIIRALGVRHSGGVVVTSIQAGEVGVVPEIGINNIAMPIVGGVAVWGVSGRAAEIGQIYIDPTARGGSGVPTDNPGGANETQWTVNVLLHGSVALDVYDISSNPNVVFNRIRNESGYRGEDGVFVGGNFFNGLVEGVGELYAAGNIGVAAGSTGADLGSTRILVQQIPAYQDQDADTLYPLGLRDTGWVVVRADGGPATVGRIATGRAMANLLIAGDVREIIADVDHSFRSDDGVFEGIAGPIWITNIAHTHPSSGNYVILGTLGTLDIGEGVAPIGSGMVGGGAVVVGDTNQALTGMVGRIDVVRNRGLGSDIAGAIVTTGEIGRITIDDGALIGARIFTRLRLHYMAAEPLSYLVPIFGEAVGNIETDIELGSLQINGRGGIIGSYIGGTDMGPISVRGGFGIIHSVIEMGTYGSLASLYVDGYGLRDSRIIGGERIGDITLGGRGQSIAASPLIFTPSVFQSELGVNPFGQAISVYSDLHAYLGTSAATREIAGVTDSGVIEDSVVKSARYLANVRAYQIRTRGGTEEPSGLTSFQIAVSIESIQTLSNVDGLSIVTGSLKKFQPASDVSRLHLTVSGPIQSIVIRGNLLGGSVISSTGPSGFINQIKVSGDMFGSIESASRINSIQIGGDLAGDITIHGIGLTSRAYALGSLTLGGSLLDGSLRIVGNVNQIRITGGMGLAGEELRILGDLKSLTVGTDRSITTASMDLDLIVDGDLSTLNVNGPINGQVLVGGTLGSLILTNRTGSPIDLIAAPIAVHGDLKTARLTDGALAADLSVGGDLNSLSVRNADVSANVTAGGNINRFDLSAGSILADATVTSSLGDIKNLSISGGDLLGQVRAPNGQIQNLSIRGSDLGPDALVEAMVIRTLKLDGTVQAGASILATSELWSLIVGQDIQAGAIITAGAAKDIQVKGNLAASMTIGRGGWDSTKLTVSGDLGSTGSRIDIARGANVRVSGAILAGSTLSADGDVQLQVSGDVAGDVIAGGKIQRLSAGSLTDAVVTAGYDITALTVSGAVTRSLIQAGVSLLTGTMFFDGGTSRSGQIQSLSIGSAVSSILAAGGNIKSFKSQSMTGSTLSSGLVLAGAAIDQVRDGTLDLAVAADRNTARQGVTLLRGDILALTGGDLVASQVSAGVDPGADGDFATDADNTVVTSLTGGSSYVKVQSVNLDAASRIVADGVIDARQSMGVGEANNASVTYSIADLTTHNPLSTYFGTATAGSPLTFVAAGMRTVTLTLTGPGSVDLHDEVGFDTDMTIGTLVLNGTTSASSLVITTIFPGDVAIGRVLTADDATIGRFSFDGDLVGDSSDDPDLWIDGPVNTLSFRNLGDDLAGRIGGGVSTLTFQTQGAGSLIVGGEIKSLIVVDSSGAGIFDDLAASPLASIRQMTTSDAGATWVFDTATRKIGQVDLTTGALVGSTFSVVDPLLSGAAAILEVSAMDFGLDALSATRLLAVANALDLSPTVQVGPLTTASATLRGMAVNAAGQVFAIDSSSGTDHLVRIDTATGGIAEDRGQLRDIFGNTYSGHILALAFNSSGVLYGVTTDLDGNGSAKSTGDGAALVKLESSKSAGRDHLVVSGAGDDGLGNIVTGDAFTGSEVRGLIARTGGFYLVTNSGAASTLYSLTVTVNASSTDTVTASQIGAITAGGAAGIVGLGYDANGNLLGLSVIGGQASMIKIDTTTPASSALLSSAGVISPDIDALAIYTPTGGTPTTYAYDTDAAGGLFLTSPGVVATLGTIDTSAGPTQGQFDRLATLVKNAQGTPLGEAITAFAVAPGAAGHVFVVTQSGLLYEFDQDGALQNGGAIGQVVNQFTGQAMHIVGMDFNADGDLVGLDSLQNRLVTLNTADAQAVPRMDIGVVPAANVHGLSYDPVEERFVALGPDDMLVELTATTQAEYELVQGKIQADSINRISITGSGYAGRIVTTGNTINSVQVQDDFAGQIAASSINSYSQRSGDFSGTLAVLQDIKQFQLSAGSILADGFVQAGGSIGRLSVKGDLAGSVDARTLSQLSVSGDVTSTARIAVTGELGSADVRGDFDGTLEAGSVRSNFKIGGELGATGLVSVDGDVQTLQVSDGVAAGGAIVIGGSAKTVRFSQTFAGALDVGMSVNSASFGTLSSAWVGIGRDLSSLTVSGDMLSSVVSVGTQVGPDGLYNTADDVILGGTLKRASIRGNVIDSALVAGVLPTIITGPGMPASKFAYTADTASAGGLGRSTIGSVSVSQLVSGSALAAANGIDRVSGRHADQFSMRVLNDPLGAPTVVSIYQVSATEINVIFSEWIDLASVILSVDADGDQALASPSDVIGSLSLINADGDYISADVALSVTTLNDEFSGTRSVLRIQRTGLSNFTNEGMVTVELAGSLNPDEPSITDRTGRRSGLLNFNQHDDLARRVSDPFGTALGGGEDFSAQILTVEPPSTFSLVGSSMTLVVDQPLTFGQVFSSDRDIEIFRFDASAYEFFSWQIQSSAYVLGTLLFLDDQGTTDTADDTYETLAVPNFNGQTGLAYELPETGTYYLVLSPDYGTTPLTTYQLTMLLASSDDMLDGAINGQTGLPSGSIAYVSNTVGQHNNLLDANTPKQLVYLNFDGGRTAQYETNVDVAAFDPTLIDMNLAGYRDLFIAGGILNDVPITSIADLVASIYLDTPSASPLGSLNVQVLSGSDLSTFTSASSGLFLTTVDPSLSGLDPLVDFTTIYVGQTPSYWESAGTLGLANDIDVANMNKSGEAVILAQNFAGGAPSAGLVDKVLEYSRYLANVVAHELGHTLGLNHQPTNFINYTLRQDDPANGLMSQMNGGAGVRLHAGDDIAITVHNGDVINLDLDGLLTVQDVVDLINSAGTDRVTASINSGSGRIELTDHTSGPSNFSVAFFIGSHAAPDLGIWASVSSTTDQIIGLSVLTMIEGNFGTGLMAYAPSNVEVSGLAQLGTADMSSGEFPIGQIDTFESLMRWLA